jgi:phosphatidylglycerol---prolipoprotein diacylglyceryl transferase
VKQRILSFSLFGLDVSIYTYGTMIVLAFLLGAWWARRTARRTLGVDPERTFNVAFALLFLGIAGARLVFAFAHYADFTQTPMRFLKIWEGGLVAFGGVVAGLLWLAWWLPKHADLKGFAFLDVLSRAACLAFAIGWMAPLLAGDDFGKPTTLPWGVPVSAFENGTPASIWGVGHDPLARLHPSQVYEALLALALFFALGLVAKRARVTGRVTAVFLMAYALGRALLDLTRGDAGPAKNYADRGFLVPEILSWTQFLSIGIFFAGLAIWLIRRPDDRHPHAVAPPAP